MAVKGSKKELSVRHEQHVANRYEGKRSNSSGGAVTDEGDVRVALENALFECKAQFGVLCGQQPVRSTLLKQFEKISDEAYAVNKEPGLALRFYAPESFLADKDGWVDMMVRLLDDDVQRSARVLQRHGYVCEGRWR